MLFNDKIVLRALEPEDVDFLFEFENNQEFWHLSNTLVPFSRFDLEQYILLADKDIYAAKQVRFIIETKNADQRKAIGAIDLFDFEPKHLRAGIGVMVVKEERNKGIASGSLDLLIAYTFNDLGFHQLYCNIEEDNVESLKLFKNKGFEVVGTKKDWNRRNGRWISEHLLQLINQDV